MVIALKGSELSLALKGGRILYDASRPSNQQHDGNRNARMGMEHGRFLAALSLACANHDGGGGGSRYIYSNPGQPHFVFETQSGQMIVHAVRIP
jgi:hypothetical protein